MTILILRLRAPLQSWGSRSRFVRRESELLPTKSGMVGLLASAQGRRRTDPIEDLVGLTMAARSDQPGRMVRDFQTARNAAGTSMPLTHRYYLADAAFTAYLSGPDAVIEGLAAAIQRPRHPLYLGRRSCPPSAPLIVEVVSGPVAEAIQATPWCASEKHRRSFGGATVTLEVQADSEVYPELIARRQLQDLPLSFDPARREYGMRSVVDTQVTIPHPDLVVGAAPGGHDPMA